MRIDALRQGCAPGWRRYENNPVIGNELGECFDVSVFSRQAGGYRMYFSWRSKKSIAMTESPDGLTWESPTIVMGPRPESGWEAYVNRISVIFHEGKYWMWYSGQVCGTLINEQHILYQEEENAFSWIGLAVSEDGIHWERRDEAVMKPAQAWEKKSLMCPHVVYDEEMKKFRMWYSGGGWFEPDAIGYAESRDGIHWERYAGNPVLEAVPENLWERERATACQVVRHGEWHYMFYIGFEDIDKARINMARSKDGITGWERHPENPIIVGGRAGSWDCEAAYKPFAIYEEENDRWILWYNGRRAFVEQIGVAFHDGEDLGFDRKGN